MFNTLWHCLRSILFPGFPQFWDNILISFKGKQIAILGARGVGKTHLMTFLASGSIPTEYKQTVAPGKFPKRRFELKNLDLCLKESLDISGDKAAYPEWKNNHDQADIVLYLLRADKLLAGNANVESRVRNDLRHIGAWLEEKKDRRPKFFIIGTHCDLDPKFIDPSDNKHGNYHDSFVQLPIVTELLARSGGTQQTKVVLGSMETLARTEALAFKIFEQALT